MAIFGALFVALFVIVGDRAGHRPPERALGRRGRGRGRARRRPSPQDELRRCAQADRRAAGPAEAARAVRSPVRDAAATRRCRTCCSTRWVGGEAADRGITVSDTEIPNQLKQIIEQQFGGKKKFQQFLKQAGFTPDAGAGPGRADRCSRSRSRSRSCRTTPPSVSQDNGPELLRGQQGAVQPARDPRRAPDRQQGPGEGGAGEGACWRRTTRRQNWKEVAAKYSTDKATKATAACAKGVTKGQSEPALDAQIFSAPRGQLVGPIKGQAGYYLIEVDKVTPRGRHAALEGRAPRSSSSWPRACSRRSPSDFQTNFIDKWTSRTFCATAYVMRAVRELHAGPCHGDDPGRATSGAVRAARLDRAGAPQAHGFPGQAPAALPQGPQHPAAKQPPAVIGPGGAPHAPARRRAALRSAAAAGAAPPPVRRRTARRRRPAADAGRPADRRDPLEALLRLDEITRRLRRECPWDREQDERSIVPHTVEEAYELADAAARGDDAKLLDELGDVLFQVYFLRSAARGARRRQPGRGRRVDDRRSSSAATRTCSGRRRPRPRARSCATGTASSARRRAGGRTTRSPTCPRTCPALLYARKIQRRAVSAGLTGEDGQERLGDDQTREATERWIGETLFELVDMARRLRVDPELALRAAAQRFRDELSET